jgi:hydrogenase nickel incorporation protein HypA/HybF
MHELSVATSLIELASDNAARNGAGRVARIVVRIGVLQHVARSLYFCFEAVARGTPCEGAVLEIEEVGLTVECPACAAPKAPRGPYNFRCPDCGSPTPRVLTGRELQLVAIILGPDDPVDRAADPERRPLTPRSRPARSASWARD